MWNLQSRCKQRRSPWWTFLCAIIFFIGSLPAQGFLFSSVPTYAAAMRLRSTSASCPAPADPTSQSLLIVLLDRSGSLIAGQVPTDPKLYSTSVTKALADIWPGNMAVIPFGADQTPTLGPYTLSNPQQATTLKQKVQDYPIDPNADTPLGPAVHGALDLLNKQGYPAGSRVIVITDGNPTGAGNSDGPHQEQDIRQNLLPQFCSKGVPFGAFGLTIDTTTSDGQDANRLLTDIASGTGASASYNNVTGPQDLAKQVVSLASQWLHLTFTQISGSGGNFQVSIDRFAQKVSIVSFRSDNKYSFSLDGPNGQAAQGIQKSTPADPHYEIDTLNVSGGVTSGTYTQNVGGDPDAQVYALVQSSLGVELASPTATGRVYDNKPVTIQAQFTTNKEVVTPSTADIPQIIAKATLLVDGKAVGPTTDVVLTQDKTADGKPQSTFSGATPVYNQPGQVQIELQGNYQGAKAQSSTTVQLLKPVPVVPPPPPRKPPNYTPIIIGGAIGLGIFALLLLLLFLFLRWRAAQPKPYGYITNGRRNGAVALTDFSRARVSSNDIMTKGVFSFGAAVFELVFDTSSVIIRTVRSNAATVEVEVQGQTRPVQVTDAGIEIKSGKKIYVNGKTVASFENSPNRVWTPQTLSRTTTN